VSEPPSVSPRKYLQRQLEGAAEEFYRRLSAGELATTRCERCGRTDFPPRSSCARCGAESSWVELPREGILHAFTTQEVALRFRAPTVIALVELGPAVLPAVCEVAYAELEIGRPVSVEPQVEPETGLPVLRAIVAGGGRGDPLL
jgi:hypothetical protein